MLDAVALGELLIDFACLSTDAEGYPVMAAHPGGAPANFLAAMQKFGGSTALIAKVGSDSFGTLLCKTLRNAGIRTEGVRRAEDVFTTLAFVTFNEQRDREFSFARKPGADTRLCREELPLALIDEAKVFHFGTLSMTDEPANDATRFAVAYARERGKLISFDPNLRRPLWDDLARAKSCMLWGLGQADVVKISDEECSFLFGPISYEEASARICREYGVKLVFVTQGSRGCLYRNANGSGFVPAMAGLKVVDTTGAGDIFGGSAVWKLLQTGKAPEALTPEEMDGIARFACASAGLSTTRSGGISSVPELDQVFQNL